MSSDYGLVLKGIKDNDRSVMNAGINIYWFKAQALFYPVPSAPLPGRS
jgi:branched-chain amino acid transport system permease protein